MTRTRMLVGALLAALVILPTWAEAQSPTVTEGPATATPTEVPATATPTHTATLTPTVPTATPTHTHTPTITPTINVSRVQIGQRLTQARLNRLTNFCPGCRAGNLSEILQLGVRQVQVKATNATALGLEDVGVVTSILAFVNASGAPATQTLLIEGTDYTVADGDVTPAGDASAQTWLITYRPF